MKRGRLPPLLLVVVLAVALVGAGLVYAHWTDTLEMQGQVQTGSIDPEWTEDGTSDDGFDDPWGFPDNEVREAIYTYPGRTLTGPSSADQTLRDGDIFDLEKDVATCVIYHETDTVGDPEDRLVIIIENAYPSYFCDIYFDLHNRGSVPVKMQELRFEAFKNGFPMEIQEHFAPVNAGTGVFHFAVDEVPGNSDVELEFGFGTGDNQDPWSRAEFPGFFGCEFQLDPDVSYLAEGIFHLGQDAEQGATYELYVEMDWVNWNEYEAEACPPIVPN